MKKFLFLVFLVICGWIGYQVLQLEPNEPPIDLYTLIPANAIYVTEIEQPIEKWRQFSDGKIWQHLKGNPYLASVNESVENLRGTLYGKETLLRNVLSDNLLISAHITQSGNDYDYLYLINLNSIGRLKAALPTVIKVFETGGYKVGKEQYQDLTIYKLTDELGETLSFCLKNNALLASYHLPLLKKAIDTAPEKSIATNPDFTYIKQLTDNRGLSNFYLQYRSVDELVGCYAATIAPPLKEAIDMLQFSGLNVKVSDDAMEFRGKSLLNPKSESYLKAITKVGKAQISAHNILPSNTSFYISFCFDDFNDFKEALGDAASDDDDKKGIIGEFIEKELTKELPEWIDQEIALAMVPRDANDSKQTYVAVIPTGKNKEMVAEKLENILQTLDQLNPLSIFQNDEKKMYNGYRIIKLPGAKLLRKFGGGLLKDIEKPYMVLIDQYLVLCDSEDLLKQIIDEHESGNSLPETEGYKAFFNSFERQSNVYVYLQSKEIYPFLSAKLKGSKKKSLEENKDYFLSFPHVGLQMLPEGNFYQTYLHASYAEE